MSIKPKGSFAADVEGDCPFCGGEFAADAVRFAVVHSMPPCPTFVELDVDDYLEAVRKRLEARPAHLTIVRGGKVDT